MVILPVNEVISHIETDKRLLRWRQILNQLSASSSCLLWIPAKVALRAGMWADFRHEMTCVTCSVMSQTETEIRWPGNPDPLCFTIHNGVFLIRAEVVNVTREINDLYISCEVTDWWPEWVKCLLESGSCCFHVTANLRTLTWLQVVFIVAVLLFKCIISFRTWLWSSLMFLRHCSKEEWGIG